MHPSGALVPVAADDTWTYVLVTPDGLVSGALPAVVDLLERDGFRVLAAFVLGLDLPTMARVYAVPAATPRRAGSGGVPAPARLFGGLYALGAACLLVLRREQGEAGDAVNRCKGNTRPEAASPGTVRHLGENVMLNLMHCPDDARAAEQELAVLLGDADGERLRELAATGDGHIDDLVGLAALSPSLPAITGREVLSFPAVANRIRRRSLQRLALRSRSNPTALAALRSAHGLLAHETNALGSLPTSLSRMRRARDLTDGIHAPLSAVAADLGEQTLVAGLTALRALYDLAGPRDPDAVLALDAAGVHITAAEQTVVETHSFAFTPHPDIDRLYGPFGSSTTIAGEVQASAPQGDVAHPCPPVHQPSRRPDGPGLDAPAQPR